MSSLTADILSKSLLELLEMSESNGPGLISIDKSCWMKCLTVALKCETYIYIYNDHPGNPI